MARFFIDRPVFAWVIAIIIMMAGLFAIRTLPVAQYPDVAPPTINISATYTGADAQTVENSVTQILEQQLTGIDGLLYFSSSSSSAGRAQITVTFEQGTDPDTAQVQVQNKVQQVTSRLPTSVQAQGVTVTKSQSDFLLVFALFDVTDTATSNDVADFLVSSMQDPIARLEGVGDVRVFGAQHAMRIWLDPTKLAAYQLIPADITSALEAQNTQVAAGSIGGLPSADTQELNATVTAQSMLQTPEQFRAIILKTNPQGAQVTLGDVARVEIGSESYGALPRLNGHPASGMAVMLAPGANALTTAELVRQTVTQMQGSFPAGYQVAYPRDSTAFIKISIEEVVKTLFEAVVLVVIVMFVFLQNWRATLIPAIAVPVVLLGTFGVLALFGYSINTLTLFGMVLSIGLLVDDAIVVVENVERVMHEEKLSPRAATIKSMKEISPALVGIAVVLSAVFLPMALFGGSTGVIYRQFSITLVSSMVLSVLVALTLSPTLCASLLKASDAEHSQKGLFGWFNRSFDSLTQRYGNRVLKMLRQPVRWMLVYGLIVAALAVLMTRLPTGFLPNEDQGTTMVQFNLPTGASVKRTEAVARQIEQYYLTQEKDNINTIFTISGFSFGGSGQNAGMAFISLKPWDQRPGAENSAAAIAHRANKALASIRDARVFAMSPPPIRGLGQSNGFSFQLLANAGTSRDQLGSLKDQLLADARQDPLLTAIREGSISDTPQLKIDIDNAKASALGLNLNNVTSTLSTAWAGRYVNDFLDKDRVKRVYVQGDAPYRASPEDLRHWFVRGTDADGNTSMTPFSAFASVHWTSGPQSLNRFNGNASFELQGAGNGVSSGAAMDEIARLADALPGQLVSHAWSGLSYQERLSSGQTTMLYSLSVLVVFLCLAALYESWTVPLSVVLVIPLGVIGAALAAWGLGLENDIYFQVALLTTIGLSSKNAILIVEFAEEAYQQGQSAFDAAVQGAKLRLRPILMTSLAFIFGTLPLALSTGAGAHSRVSIGSGIVGGTFTATVLAIFLVPLFFVLVRRLFPARKPVHEDDPA
ncbi:efflux RND transporter permease subunit [Gallaecimonas xiamenensis]|uniref:Efflux pump membrane transporter n=1 Tax=Gallaecimonas xiamenensis 3-C-1 TaxID=745411 RepID=K2JN00_9GAMM|nr:efflux RND transporter permease subunit [Gallaecimonas xiamenensis]EKE75847.1 hydrophobe/amphiphile efflux-1 (HAE1) family transporter [Gallaecimonas xiamenensis 3-C-1]